LLKPASLDVALQAAMILSTQSGNGRHVNTDQIFSALQTELTTFAARRTPDYLKETIAAGGYVYGAGSYGRRILALVQAQNIPCSGIIDRKFTQPGEAINGVPALHPDKLTPDKAAGKYLLIGMHNQTANMAEIIAYGQDLGFAEVLWNADLLDALGPEAGNFWLGQRQFTLHHFAEIRAAAAALHDEESTQTLAALLRYRVTGDMAAHPHSDLTQQYAPPGLLRFSAPITFVDGGAYDGDTCKYLRGKDIAIHHWLAFEPDPANYQALASFARTVPIQSTLFPCGLSEHFIQVPFAANEGTSSHLSTGGGGMTVPCVALDDVIHGPSPDYIKLDIEGAEASALRGMRHTIAKSKPHLAISAYHRPDDLWTLPLLLKELAPYADLYLRQHSRNAFETVLYAVPRGTA
jgi:FkbM family methyltransferase